jgi:hypothetical protein
MVNPSMTLGMSQAFPVFSSSARWLVADEAEGQLTTLTLWAVDPNSGLPISNGMLDQGSLAATFDPSERSLLTLSAGGKLTRWPVAVPTDGPKGWMEHMGEALTGFRLGEQRDETRIPMADYKELRELFFDELKRAAKRGDQVAATIERRFEPYWWSVEASDSSSEFAR